MNQLLNNFYERKDKYYELLIIFIILPIFSIVTGQEPINNFISMYIISIFYWYFLYRNKVKIFNNNNKSLILSSHFITDIALSNWYDDKRKNIKIINARDPEALIPDLLKFTKYAIQIRFIPSNYIANKPFIRSDNAAQKS